MYSAKVIEEIDNGKGYWKSCKIGVFENDKQIGEYVRNYSQFYDTFFPFKIGKIGLLFIVKIIRQLL